MHLRKQLLVLSYFKAKIKCIIPNFEITIGC
jgi:hypothetical protein